MSDQIKEGDAVTTSQGERATVYAINSEHPYCALRMTDQFASDNGPAFRIAYISTLTKVTS